MRRTRPDEAGDSLVEIVLALVIIGVVIGAFVSTFSTGATASSAHRHLVTADAVLRDYAEQTKAEARDGCSSGSSFTMTYPAPGIPAGFSVDPPVGTTTACPPETTVQRLDLKVTMPNGQQKAMSIEVRTP